MCLLSVSQYHIDDYHGSSVAKNKTKHAGLSPEIFSVESHRHRGVGGLPSDRGGRDSRSHRAATVGRRTDGCSSPSPAISIVVLGGRATVGLGVRDGRNHRNGRADGRTLARQCDFFFPFQYITTSHYIMQSLLSGKPGDTFK